MVTLRPVALYARSSAVDQEEAFISREAQLGRMREYAGQKGMHPVSHFADKHGSREEFDWMMAQATSDNPPFRTVLVYSLEQTHPVGIRTGSAPGRAGSQRTGTHLRNAGSSQIVRKGNEPQRTTRHPRDRNGSEPP